MREFVLMALLLAGCMPEIPTLEPHKRKDPDAAAGASAAPTIILVPEVCRAACKTMVRLRCAGRNGSPGIDEVFGTGDEESCEVVCANIERAAEEVPGWSLNPACIAKALDCREATECVRVSSGFQ